MRKHLILALLILTTTITFAKKKRSQHIIYLKDDNIIKGQLLEVVVSPLTTTFKFKTKNGNISTYNKSEIKKITNGVNQIMPVLSIKINDEKPSTENLKLFVDIVNKTRIIRLSPNIEGNIFIKDLRGNIVKQYKLDGTTNEIPLDLSTDLNDTYLFIVLVTKDSHSETVHICY